MRKIITISILFFSCCCFSQVKRVEKKSVEESVILDSMRSTTLQNEVTQSSTILNNENANYSTSYKRKTIEITENPLYNIKLVLPSNFNWLHISLV